MEEAAIEYYPAPGLNLPFSYLNLFDLYGAHFKAPEDLCLEFQ
jgi:hypothetical protein